MNNASRHIVAIMSIALWATTYMAAAQESAAAPPQDAKREAMNKEVDEAVEAIRAYSIEQRDQALARAQEAMKSIDGKIDALQDDMNQRQDRMSASARRQSRATMADLQDRRRRLSEWQDRMHRGSGKAWEDVKAGFVDSYRGLADALRKARADFEQESAPEESGDKGDAMSAFRVAHGAYKRSA